MITGQAFDQMSPKASVTDPQGLGLETAYPKHLHQAGAAEDGGPLYRVVLSAAEEAAAVADGWLVEKPGPATAPAAGRSEAPKHPRKPAG